MRRYQRDEKRWRNTYPAEAVSQRFLPKSRFVKSRSIPQYIVMCFRTIDPERNCDESCDERISGYIYRNIISGFLTLIESLLSLSLSLESICARKQNSQKSHFTIASIVKLQIISARRHRSAWRCAILAARISNRNAHYLRMQMRTRQALLVTSSFLER